MASLVFKLLACLAMFRQIAQSCEPVKQVSTGNPMAGFAILRRICEEEEFIINYSIVLELPANFLFLSRASSTVDA